MMKANVLYIGYLFLTVSWSTEAAILLDNTIHPAGETTANADQIPGQLYELGGHDRSVFDKMFYPDTMVDVHLAWNGELFKMTLSLGHSLANTDTILGIRTGSGHLQVPADDRSTQDCFSSGQVHSHSGVVVFSHCGREINGIIATPNHQYSLSIDKKFSRQRRSVSEGLTVKVIKRSVGASEIKDDIVQMVRDNEPTRRKRSAESDLVIELGLWMDQSFNEGLEARGLVTSTEKVDALLLLYATEAALLNMPEELGVSIQLDIKYIEIWETDPDWYITSEYLSGQRISFCAGINENMTLPDFDLKGLHTMVQLDSNTKGNAWISKTCNQAKNCYAIRTDVLHVVHATVHEIGHQLGMLHNNGKKCNFTDDTSGMMGSGRWVWSNCSATVLRNKMNAGAFSCLNQTNVEQIFSNSLISETHTMSSFLPGQSLSKDEACRMYAGKDAVLYDYDMDTCDKLTCAAQKGGVRFVTTAGSFLPGSYCGDGKICFRTTKSEDCHLISGTGIAHKEIVQGGWTRFGPWSDCSRSCGTGITYRKRECANPVPVNAPHCPGSRMDYALCNTEACDTDEQTDIATIRSSVCSALNESVITAGDGGCDVLCLEHKALLPDGTSCAGTNAYCLEGQCLVFTSKWFKYETDAAPTKFGGRVTLFTIPGNTRSVDVSFSLAELGQAPGSYYFEIWSKENTADVRPYGLGLTETGRNPINYAGTYWGYSNQVVELYSDPDISLSVAFKVKLKKRCSATIVFNTTTILTYTQPLADTSGQCTGTCVGYGTWDSTICSCDCNSGYYGATCESNCKKYCFNGYQVSSTASTCQCSCDDKTDDQLCQCNSQYTGRDCTECTDPSTSFANGCQ